MSDKILNIKIDIEIMVFLLQASDNFPDECEYKNNNCELCIQKINERNDIGIMIDTIGKPKLIIRLQSMISDANVTFEQYEKILNFIRPYICACDYNLEIINHFGKMHRCNKKSLLYLELFIKPVLEHILSSVEGKTIHNIELVTQQNRYALFDLMLQCLFENDINTFNYVYNLAKIYASNKSYSCGLRLPLDNCAIKLPLDDDDDDFASMRTFESCCIVKLCVNGFKIIHTHDPYSERYMHRLYILFWKNINDYDHDIKIITEFFDWMIETLNDFKQRRRLLIRFFNDFTNEDIYSISENLQNLIDHCFRHYNTIYKIIDLYDYRTYTRLYQMWSIKLIEFLPNPITQKQYDDIVGVVDDAAMDIICCMYESLDSDSVYIVCKSLVSLLAKNNSFLLDDSKKNEIIETIIRIFIFTNTMKISDNNNYRNDTFYILDKMYNGISREIINKLFKSNLDSCKLLSKIKSFDKEFISSLLIKPILKNNNEKNEHLCMLCMNECTTCIINCSHTLCSDCLTNSLNIKKKFNCSMCELTKNQ